MTQPQYADKGKSKGLPLWGILLLVFGAAGSLGTCVWGFGGLFKTALETQHKTDEFLVDVFKTGLPETSDPIYLAEGDMTWKQETVDRINLFLTRVGTARSAEDSVCSTESKASLTGQNGTFSTCFTAVTYDATPARVTTVWKMKDGEAYLYSFNINVENEELGRKILGDIALIERSLDPDELDRKVEE